MLIGQFKNPVNWNQPYDPGKIIAELLAQERTHKKRVQLVSISENMMEPMDNHQNSPDNHNMEPAIYDSWKMSFPGIVAIQGPNPKMMKPMQKMNRMDKMGTIMGPPWL